MWLSVILGLKQMRKHSVSPSTTLSLSNLLNLAVLSFFTMSACTTGMNQLTEEEAQVDLQKKVSRKGPVFIAEGSLIKPQDCEELYPSAYILGKYIAKIQGGKAVLKEHCLAQDSTKELKTILREGPCTDERCSSYDTYRRGPLWPALYMASLNLALQEEQIKLGYLNKTVVDDQILHETTEETTEEVNQDVKTAGVFTTVGHQKVSMQTVRFKLSPRVKCVAKLKNFHEDHYVERRDNLQGNVSVLRFSAAPNSGDIWVEHRQTAQGNFELLMMEKRFADDRGEGEVQEQEILCIHPNQPIDPLSSYFTFSYEEINRDTTRVYVSKNR
jgi:hypothetical protein